MTCDEGRIVAFFRGELSGADEQAFDEHLLSCESCWSAVREDRVGRLALERLRVSAPLGLADRVSASVDLAGKLSVGATTGQVRDPVRDSVVKPGFLSPRRLVAAAAVVIVLLGGTLGWVLADHAASDPPQITGVLAMMAPKVAKSPALRSGEHFDLGGQSVMVRSYEVEGITTLVATSARPFPMPASSRRASSASTTAWTATDGRYAMYGVNRSAGDAKASMFVMAAMPTAKLPQVAALLHVT